MKSWTCAKCPVAKVPRYIRPDAYPARLDKNMPLEVLRVCELDFEVYHQDETCPLALEGLIESRDNLIAVIEARQKAGV